MQCASLAYHSNIKLLPLVVRRNAFRVHSTCDRREEGAHHHRAVYSRKASQSTGEHFAACRNCNVSVKPLTRHPKIDSPLDPSMHCCQLLQLTGSFDPYFCECRSKHARHNAALMSGLPKEHPRQDVFLSTHHSCTQDDRTVTSMVPASVRVRREEPSTKLRLGPGAAVARSRPVVGPGFGLAPAAPAGAAAATPAAAVARPAAPGAPAPGTAIDRKYQAFLAEMSELGAV